MVRLEKYLVFPWWSQNRENNSGFIVALIEYISRLDAKRIEDPHVKEILHTNNSKAEQILGNL